jgi:RNA polymerase sigma-70 factor (ECF subfamily)
MEIGSGSHDLSDRIIALLPRLRRFALTLTRDPSDGDDLVQTTVERALSRMNSWDEGSRLDSWMFKIMQNLWIDQTRARRTRGTQAPEAELGDLPGTDGRTLMDHRLTLRATLAEALALPEEQRAALLLVVVEGFSYRQAAEVLGVPVGTVMSRLSRARLALEGRVFGERPPLSKATP